ncbi:hypothetical protein [Xenorhabdus sp. IM139775]|uniref:hypothetical protein n=1 Tax=Xenorhabdus sp. IM139775 TaxID=3025876 RepID=UPI002359DE87|nr:hypothetical protein [Xenorhabdus sp. IM139775]MDC9592969.1 hypothetical protein [Xenorhabdus sp. IM139775]
MQFKKEVNLTRLLDIINSKDNNPTGLIKHIGEVQSKKNTKTDEPYIIVLKIISAGCTTLSGFIEGARVTTSLFEWGGNPHSSDILTKINNIINYFSIVIATINIICLAFYSYNDFFSIIMWTFSLFLVIILVSITVCKIIDPSPTVIGKIPIENRIIIVCSTVFGVIIFLFSLIYGLITKQNWTDIVLGCLFGLWSFLDVVALIKLPFPWPVFSVAVQGIAGLSAGAIKIYKLTA